jgi:predicted  nucleic acid-binding Zn-ribbon protein
MADKLKMLDQMTAVSEAQYLQEHAKVKPILDREAALRGQLSKLDSQIKETRAQADGDHAMRALGADLLWQGWHSRMRRELNMQLAQVTAQKLQAMDKLREAFGRKHAVETMAKDERKRVKQLKAKKLQENLLQSF